MKVIISAFVTCWMLILPVKAQDNLDLFGYWKYYSDAENALYKTSCDYAFQQLEQREQQIAGLSGAEAHLNHQQLVKQKLSEIMGEFPERTPLNVQISGVLKKQDFRVEKIIYESIPGYYVSAALFLPSRRKGKLPAIVYASGHTDNGFRGETYQHVIINLVKKGFAVFAFDPVGQGERWQYFDETGEKRFKGTTIEHSYPGAQCYISGHSPTRYFVWDGIRAVDYLLTRKEIDPERIGMTGRSGGGTQTAYTAAMDDRILAAAPECYITNMEYLLKSNGPQDAEQNLIHMLAQGLDHADLLEVRAPKPTLMVTTTRDIFSIQGARDTFSEAQKFYSAMGAADQISMVEDDEGHASTKNNREAMYAFFQKYLDNPGDSQDLEVEIFEESELWVTETGSVAKSLGSKDLFSLNQQVTLEQVTNLNKARESRSSTSEIATAAAHWSGFKYPSDDQVNIFSGRTQDADVHLETYLISGSGDYQLPVGMYRPLRNVRPEIVLLFDELGMKHAANTGNLVRELTANGYTVLLADLPGTGDLGPGYLKGDAYVQNTSYNQWFAGILTAKSIVAIRAQDIIRLIRFARSEVGQDYRITTVSTGVLGSELLHAAVFEEGIDRIALISPFLSYGDIALTSLYQPSFIPSVVAGAIKDYDLVDLMAACNPRDILVVNPLKASGEPYHSGEAGEVLQYPMTVYQSGSFEVAYELVSDQISTSLLEWLD